MNTCLSANGPAPADRTLVVMGVSGSGKSDISQAIAAELGWRHIEADLFHPRENVERMRAGIPLSDADRVHWLDALIVEMQAAQAAGQGFVLACSALKRVYRDRIREQAGDVCFVFLDGEFELIQKRMHQRVGHYMQPGLLDSQFRTLEKPQADENDVIRLPITEPVQDMVEQALNALHTRLHPAL